MSHSDYYHHKLYANYYVSFRRGTFSSIAILVNARLIRARETRPNLCLSHLFLFSFLLSVRPSYLRQLLVLQWKAVFIEQADEIVPRMVAWILLADECTFPSTFSTFCTSRFSALWHLPLSLVVLFFYRTGGMQVEQTDLQNELSLTRIIKA